MSNHLSSFSIPLPLIFKKQMTPLMKKIQGLQALHGATSEGAARDRVKLEKIEKI